MNFFWFILALLIGMHTDFSNAKASPTARAVALQSTLRHLNHRNKVDAHVYNHVKDEIYKVGLEASKNYSTPIYALVKANRLAWNGIKNENHSNYLKLFLQSYMIAFNCLHVGYFKELKLLDGAFNKLHTKK